MQVIRAFIGVGRHARNHVPLRTILRPRLFFPFRNHLVTQLLAHPRRGLILCHPARGHRLRAQVIEPKGHHRVPDERAHTLALEPVKDPRPGRDFSRRSKILRPRIDGAQDFPECTSRTMKSKDHFSGHSCARLVHRNWAAAAGVFIPGLKSHGKA